MREALRKDGMKTGGTQGILFCLIFVHTKGRSQLRLKVLPVLEVAY